MKCNSAVSRNYRLYFVLCYHLNTRC